MTRAILVKSCQRFRPRREACAKTWAFEISAARRNIPIYFVEGGHDKDQIVTGLDMVLELTCRDDYDSNSIKVRDAISILLSIHDFDSLFICDDNTFVHPARWLAHEPGGEFEGLVTEKIPHAHGGGGWWQSRRCCELYVAGVKRRCSWDDQLATEILTGKHGIPMVNRPDLYAQWDERVSAENDLITCHNVEPAEQFQLFEATRDLSPVRSVLSRA